LAKIQKLHHRVNKNFIVTFVTINWVDCVDVEKVCGGRSHGSASHVLHDHGFDQRSHEDDELAWATEISERTKVVVDLSTVDSKWSFLAEFLLQLCDDSVYHL
jgi:hypothetical protein